MNSFADKNTHPATSATMLMANSGFDQITLHPPAKINLSLIIFGKRADNFHELHTIMGTTDFHDDLTLRHCGQEGIHLTCSGIPCPAGPENLVFRAAQLLAGHCGLKPAVEIHLHKRIPSGGGLGGASSDTAACLFGLNALWQTGLSLAQLAELAGKLGSDIPFFLHGPIAQCTGRGEIIEPLPLRCTVPLLLIMPDIHVPTPLVYQHYRYQPEASQNAIRQAEYFLKRGDLDSLVRLGINNLTEVTMKITEKLDALRHRLISMGIGPVFMSGSGSSLFVPGNRMDHLVRWQQQIEEAKLATSRVIHFLAWPHLTMEVHHASI